MSDAAAAGPGHPIAAREVSFGFTPGDVVIVTGAGSGIGRATALGAAAQGLAVAAWDIDVAGGHGNG